MNRKLFVTTLVGLIGLVGFAGCSSAPVARSSVPAAPSSVPVVRIGHAAPLSGQLARLGSDNQRGAELAVEELNTSAPLVGGKPVRFELVGEDDRANPGAAQATARRLVDAKVAAVVGHLNSGVSIPASRVYRDAGIPMISPASTNPQLTRQGLSQTFRLVADDSVLATLLGRHAVQALGAKRVAIVDDGTFYGKVIADGFQAGARGAGAEIINQQSINDRTSDFGPLVKALLPTQPDLVVFGGMDGQAGPLLREMQRQGLSAKLAGGDGICSDQLPKLAGGALPDDKVWCPEAGDATAALTPEGEQFKRRYTERFKTEPYLYSPYTYDAVRLLAKAMVDSGSTDPLVFTPALAKTTGWRGATGRVSFDAKGDLINGPITVYTYRGGVRTQVGVVR